MGNKTSTTNNGQQDNKLKPKPIFQTLDYIATHYILTMNFKSLRKLYDKDYCDKLVILTSDIVKRYFTDIEITYLYKRIKNGVEVNEKDNIIFFDRDDLNKLDIQTSIKKKRICLEISKFYIKIAHIFAAIVKTINPIYVYKDSSGNTVRASLYEKGNIPPNTPRDIYKLNICNNRITSLTNNHELEPDSNGNITVGPNMCNSNMNDDGNVKTLEDEPGISELMQLYYDDNYDFKTGTFTGMTKETQEIFQKDLKLFYNVFTGNSDFPIGITKFSDIKLREYNKMEGCKGEAPSFETKYTEPLSNKLFKEYAENLKKMMNTTNINQQALLTIINQLFVYTLDPQTGKKQIRIEPSLTENKLQEIVVKTRALIIKLYLSCEQDYVTSLKIYEAIVETQMLDTTKKRINALNNLEKQLLIPNIVPEPAEYEQIKKNI